MSNAVLVQGTVYGNLGYEVIAVDHEGQPVEEYHTNNNALSGGVGLSEADARSKWYGLTNADLFTRCTDTAREMAEEFGLDPDVAVDVRDEEDW